MEKNLNYLRLFTNQWFASYTPSFQWKNIIHSSEIEFFSLSDYLFRFFLYPRIKSRNKKFKLHFHSNLEQEENGEEQLQFVNTQSPKSKLTKQDELIINLEYLCGSFYTPNTESNFNCTAENWPKHELIDRAFSRRFIGK